MKTRFLLLLLLLNSFFIFAQAPGIEWQKAYGGSLNDGLGRIIATNDGGFIIAADSQSGISGDKTVATHGGDDYWIIKLSATGDIEWQESLGGSGQERYPTIIQTTDNGYLIGGVSDSDASGDKTENTHGFNDYWVIKLDQAGTVQWQNTIGADLTDFLSTAIQTPDGGYLLGGGSVSNISDDKSESNIGLSFGAPYYTYYDYWVVKIDAVGNVEWDNVIGSKMTDYLSTMVNTPDGGYLIGGFSDCDPSGDYSGTGNGGHDCWLLKLNAAGNISWQKTIGGNAKDELQTMITTSDGGFLLAAISNSGISGDKTENADGSDDFWIIKLDAAGNIVWNRTIGGSTADWPYSLNEDNAHNFYISGISNSPASADKTEESRGGYDYWVVKINADGAVIWDKTIGGAQNETYCSSSYDIADNSVILAGTSLSSATGDRTPATRGFSDIWAVKLEPDNLSNAAVTIVGTSIYPNPSNGTFHVAFAKSFKSLEIRVTNILGQTVQQTTITNAAEAAVDIAGSAGVYFIDAENEAHEKFVFKVVRD